MFKIKIHFMSAVLFLVLAGFASAESIQVQIDQAVPHGNTEVGVGSSIQIKLPGKETHSGKFLGRMVNPDGSLNQYMVMDEDQRRIYMVSEKNIDLPKRSYQNVLRQYDQMGGTCTGYAIDHMIQQMKWSGFEGNGTLEQILSTEKGRTQLLVDAINQYYLVTQRRFSILGIMNGYGKQFGFKCAKKLPQTSEEAVQYLEKHLAQGLPVMVSFDTGPDMLTSAYTIQDFDQPTPLYDRRLWIPRKTGERNSGGHTVVAVSMFESKGRKKMLMLDSDWDQPRIWDVTETLGDKTALGTLEFYSCK